MKTKEQVKQGKLKISEAMNLVSPDCKTYRWLENRSRKQRNENKTSTKEQNKN